MSFLAAWGWLLITLPPLLYLQRWITRHIQIIFQLLVQHDQIAIVLNQLLFIPGVLVHETSHWLMAKLVGARTVGFSIWPQRQDDGTLRMGFVQTERVDFVREALIGVAPLLAGSGVVVLISYSRLAAGDVGGALALGDLALAAERLRLADTRDLLVWLYFLFTLSNTMLPSASDRRAWPTVVLLLAILGGLLAYLGVGPLVEESFGELIAVTVRIIAGAFTITILLDLLAFPLVFAVEWLLWQWVGPRLLEKYDQ
ncbi:MAG: hypothetical protein ACE5FI_06110 [Anaerolineales bacterium]